MKYIFLIYSAEKDWTDETRQACMLESMGICDALEQQGKFIAASPLQYVETASCVRVRDGQTQLTTGPFAETTEQLGGFYIVELDNLDEAIAIASKLPPAQKGTVEIRPIFPLDGMPSSNFGLLHQVPSELTPFILLCYDDEEYWRNAGLESHRAAMMEAVAVTWKLDSQKKFISASPLYPSETATSVRVRNGQRLVSDGPFAETNEVLGGFYLMLAKDQAEAESIAVLHSGARVGAVEVRPLFDVSAIR
jgi:hypothetical protein